MTRWMPTSTPPSTRSWIVCGPKAPQPAGTGAGGGCLAVDAPDGLRLGAATAASGGKEPGVPAGDHPVQMNRMQTTGGGAGVVVGGVVVVGVVVVVVVLLLGGGEPGGGGVPGGPE